MIETDLVAEELVERFMRYAAVDSQSDAATTALPSTPGQLRLAEMLRDELEELGPAAIHLAAEGILTARLPGTLRGARATGGSSACVAARARPSSTWTSATSIP